jgi:hypothetical protein
MVTIFQLFATYAPYIYLACGLTALLQLYRLWQVRSERRQALFSLERERAVQDLHNIFVVALFLLLVMGITYFAGNTVPRALVLEPAAQPTLPAQFALEITPTNTPLSVTETSTPLPTLTPTLTAPTPEPLQATQTALVPTAPPAPAAAPSNLPGSCPDSRSTISAPSNNATVSGVLALVGTAAHDQFNYYKIEFAPGINAEQGFTYLTDGRGQVFNDTLASINTRGLANGPWTFQLTVVDQTGNFPPPCRVTLTIAN